jgi:hypothetical protein
VDRAPAPALDGRHHAVAVAQLRAGAARQALVVKALEARALVLARRRASGDGGGRRIGGQQPPVSAEDLRAGGTLQDHALDLLAGAQAGQAQVRGPRDARLAVLVVHLQRDRPAERPEDLRRHRHRQVEAPVASLGHAADAHALDPGAALRRPYEACEPGPRIGCAAALVEHQPHPVRLAPHPRGGEALRRAPTHVLVVMTIDEEPHHPSDGRDEHEHDEQRSPGHAVAPAAPPAARLEPGHAGAARRGRGEHGAAAATAHTSLSSVLGGGMRCAPLPAAGWIVHPDRVSRARRGRKRHVHP